MCFSDVSSSNSYECAIFEYIIAFLFLALAIYAGNRTFAGYANQLKRYWYFGKNGPVEWGRTFPDALGKRQSPVNVISDEVCCAFPSQDGCSSPLTFVRYDTLPAQYTLCNDGVKAVLTGKWDDRDLPYIMGGPMGSVKYYFSSLNFRWGPSDTWGSEHMLNYRGYPLELQLIHKTKDISNPSEDACPTSAGDTFCVISYFFKIVHYDNKYLNPIIHSLGKVEKSQTKVWVQPFPLQWLAPAFAYDYFSYRGSLTEPPCSEIAIWLLRFYPTLCISRRQLDLFRRLRSVEGPIVINSRPVQNLNGRSVCYYSQV